MESELYALQAVAQEMVSVGKFMGRVMRNIGRGSKDSMSGVLYSDSESSLKLLRNLDVPRKSRHLEIKLEWIKEQVNRGSLVLSFLKGTNNPSDLLTKCLGTSAFEYHRSCLGFEVIEGSLSSLTHNLMRNSEPQTGDVKIGLLSFFLSFFFIMEFPPLSFIYRFFVICGLILQTWSFC